MKKWLFVIGVYITQISTAQVQTEYHSNGKKKSEGEFVVSSSGVTNVLASDGSSRQVPNKTKNGLWEYWYDSGAKSSQESYLNGLTIGVWKTWYMDGSMSSEINYTTSKATFWYANGTKQSEGGMLTNRVFDGNWTGWNENGKKSYEGTYINGKKEGVWNWFDKTGKQVSKQTYKNDELLNTEKF